MARLEIPYEMRFWRYLSIRLQFEVTRVSYDFTDLVFTE